MAVLWWLEKVEEVVVGMKRLVSTGSGEDVKLIVSVTKLTVRGNYDLTLGSLRVLLLGRSTIGMKLNREKIHIIDRKLYEALFKVTEEQATADFIEASTSLLTNQIYLTPAIWFTGWFRECTLREDKSALEVKWNPDLAEHLEPSSESIYQRFNLNLVKDLTSVLAIRLHRLVQPLTYFKDVSTFTSDLVFRLGIQDFIGTSKQLKELLLPAIEEINSVTTLQIKPNHSKKGVVLKLSKSKESCR